MPMKILLLGLGILGGLSLGLGALPVTENQKSWDPSRITEVSAQLASPQYEAPESVTLLPGLQKAKYSGLIVSGQDRTWTVSPPGEKILPPALSQEILDLLPGVLRVSTDLPPQQTWGGLRHSLKITLSPGTPDDPAQILTLYPLYTDSINYTLPPAWDSLLTALGRLFNCDLTEDAEYD